jgi:N-acetylglucosamine kinase-like BadF-type ATPase
VKLVLGIDAGGTTTDALVCTPDGRLVGVGSAGPGNWEEIGVEAAVRAIVAATAAAGTTPRDVHAAGLALAGIDWPGDEQLLEPALKASGMPRRRVLVNDAFAALRAGAPDGVGIVSCAGTGCISAGRAPDGRSFRTLAVGYGEWGGAWELAREAAHAIARARHGTGPPTALSERVPNLLGLHDEEDLFRAIARRGYHPDPSLARVVLQAANEGDPVARQIAAAGGTGLAASAAAVAARLELEPPFLVVRSGGVHRAGCAALDAAFTAEIEARLPGCEVRMLSVPPAAGAALLALDELGHVAPSVHHRLLEEAAR